MLRILQKPCASPSDRCLVGIIAFYLIVSSASLLSNKLALKLLPLPTLLASLQFAFVAACLMFKEVIGVAGYDIHLWDTCSTPSAIHVVLYGISVYASMRALETNSVATLIVIHSLCPMLFFWMDWIFLGCELPSLRSCWSLLYLAGGGWSYVTELSEEEGWTSYRWATIWVFNNAADVVYAKHIDRTRNGSMNLWRLMLLSNVLCIFPMICFGFVTGELAGLVHVVWHLETETVVVVMVSCISGASIGWAAWKCRLVTSAESFAGICLSTKLLSSLLSLAAGVEVTTLRGMGSLFVCVVASATYQRAPERKYCTQRYTADAMW